eukprot:GHVO01054141.1.p2 GENE.GHVO01054141.1~~GHVO01054141.1.p2  ORF type:complete len:499 (+),score=61.52 GHVO01054141.1:656-2152(+)
MDVVLPLAKRFMTWCHCWSNGEIEDVCLRRKEASQSRVAVFSKVVLGGGSRLTSSSIEPTYDASRNRKVAIRASAKSAQHPLKKALSEEAANADAFLVSPLVLGVADGVSSVELEGFDASQLPMELLLCCAFLQEQHTEDQESFKRMVDSCCPETDWSQVDAEGVCKFILAVASSLCQRHGSTTCCLGMLDEKASRLNVVNVGDSQLLVLRRTAVPPRSRRKAVAAASQLFWREVKDVMEKRENRITSEKAGPVDENDENTESNLNKDDDFLAFDEYVEQYIASVCEVTGEIPEGTHLPEAPPFNSSRRFADSGALGGYVPVHKTVPQQHFFNCPYQITNMPDVPSSANDLLRRTLSAVESSSCEIQVGDIVIVGTDGVFDNLFEDDIIEIVNEVYWDVACQNTPIPLQPPKYLADRIVSAALTRAASEDGTVYDTPFLVNARNELGRWDMPSGKPDDTTIVVAYIVSPEAETALKAGSIEMRNLATKKVGSFSSVQF